MLIFIKLKLSTRPAIGIFIVVLVVRLIKKTRSEEAYILLIFAIWIHRSIL